MSNKYTSVYDWLKYIKANVVGINLRELRVISCISLPYFPVVYHTIMMNFIENVLCRFESCFSRKAAFRWFVAITLGLMLRSDKLGLTSVIRDLALSPSSYDSPCCIFSGHPPGRWMIYADAGFQPSWIMHHFTGKAASMSL